jgi:hypothetical protein
MGEKMKELGDSELRHIMFDESMTRSIVKLYGLLKSKISNVTKKQNGVLKKKSKEARVTSVLKEISVAFLVRDPGF